MNKPKVAVVIIHWNRRALLEQFLPALIKSTYSNVEIVLADNNSDDDSIAYVKETFPNITIVKNNKNYGYAGGYNQALKQVKADYYVLLNNDIEVTPGWIEPVIEYMVNNPDTAAAQPIMLDYQQKELFEYAGAAGGFIDYLGYAFCKGRIFESIEVYNPSESQTRNVFWATGACLFIKADVFHEAGGFDEHFFAHMEEIDLCWRLQLLGYQLAVVANAQVYHVGGGTLNKQSAQKTYLNFRNNLIMLTKNLPLKTLIWLIPLRSFLDLLSSIFFFINGFPKYSLAVHKAHSDYFFKFRKWWKLRDKKFNKKTFSELKGVYHGSIVAEHFIAKKSSFKQLDESKFT
ncbi:MAG: glycosyltransferase family 2 protein [Bacteroidia bacterium]|jgi:hypothetical protein|nr:glycosyltransferase family 2 protein [Bacteroidia bacterium]